MSGHVHCDELDTLDDATREFVESVALAKKVPYGAVIQAVWAGWRKSEIEALSTEQFGRFAADDGRLAAKTKPAASHFPGWQPSRARAKLEPVRQGG